MTENLRTRLLVAAQRFANEIADAIEEASGERERLQEERPRTRRTVRRAPPSVGPVSESALAEADAAIERAGLGRRTGT